MSKRKYKTCLNCGKAFFGQNGKFCSRACDTATGRMKGNRYNWKGGLRKDTSGYLMRYCLDHPNREKSGYVREHRLVMERHLGRTLLKTEVVHHINGDKLDNRIENLMLFASNSEHLKADESKRKYKICGFCGKQFFGQNERFCSAKCMWKNQKKK